MGRRNFFNMVNLYLVTIRLYKRATKPTIGDAHLTVDGGGARGPSKPQCLAGRTLGTWLPYRTVL